MDKFARLFCVAAQAAVVTTPKLAFSVGASLPAVPAQNLAIRSHLILVGKPRCFARYVCSKGWIVRQFICGGASSVTKTNRKC
jgi:hypothetical protein